MDKRKNAFCDVPVIPTDRIDVLGIHIVDSNLTCRYRSVFLYNRIVQIRDICHGPGIRFPFLVIISHNQKMIVIQNLPHKFLCRFVFQCDHNSLIQQQISNVFRQLLCHSHAFPATSFTCPASGIHLVERKLPDIGIVPADPFIDLPVERSIHRINPLFPKITKDIHPLLSPPCCRYHLYSHHPRLYPMAANV